MILLDADKNTQDISLRFVEHETTQEQLLKKRGETEKREGGSSVWDAINNWASRGEIMIDTYLNSRGNATKRHRNMWDSISLQHRKRKTNSQFSSWQIIPHLLCLLQGAAVGIQNATEFGLITTATIEREEEEEEETVTQHYYNNNCCFLRAYYVFRGLLLQRERERETNKQTSKQTNTTFKTFNLIKGRENRHTPGFYVFSNS